MQTTALQPKSGLIEPDGYTLSARSTAGVGVPFDLGPIWTVLDDTALTFLLVSPSKK
jgi:hypothetical protein